MTRIRTARPEYYKNGQLEMVLEVVGGGSLTNGDGSRFVTDVAAVLVAVLSSMPVCLSVCPYPSLNSSRA